MKRKNQHYVPQFHLKKWSFDGKSIMVYNVLKRIYNEKASIKGQASEDYLYGQDETLENALAMIEDYMAPIYETIIKNKSLSQLDEEQLDVIYLFITLCNERSLSRANELNEEATLSGRAMLKIAKANGDPKLAKISDKDIDNMQLTYTIPNSIPIEFALKYYKLITDLPMKLIHNETQYEFLTSDYPTLVYNLFSNRHKLFSGWGMSSGGIIYIFPINPYLAIFVYDAVAYDCKFVDSDIYIKNKQDINEINKLTMLNCENCVYGTPKIPQNYLTNLAKKLEFRKFNAVQELGDDKTGSLIIIQRKRINYLANFSFLKINPEYDKLPIPLNAAGIMRPQSQAIEEAVKQYWKENNSEI